MRHRVVPRGGGLGRRPTPPPDHRRPRGRASTSCSIRGALCCASLSVALRCRARRCRSERTLQPSGSIPSSRQAVSIARRAAASRMNTIARPDSELGTRDRGIGRSRPAPSPVLPSADVAPRWRTRQRPSSRSSMTSRSWFPSERATNPMPHASRSRAASCRVGDRFVTNLQGYGLDAGTKFGDTSRAHEGVSK